MAATIWCMSGRCEQFAPVPVREGNTIFRLAFGQPQQYFTTKYLPITNDNQYLPMIDTNDISQQNGR
jgi:hypothetical protein